MVEINIELILAYKYLMSMIYSLKYKDLGLIEMIKSIMKSSIIWLGLYIITSYQ